jgi:hypothetical protein
VKIGEGPLVPLSKSDQFRTAATTVCPIHWALRISRTFHHLSPHRLSLLFSILLWYPWIMLTNCDRIAAKVIPDFGFFALLA